MTGSAEDWFVDDDKITKYLLSDATDKSRSRLRFLRSFGFDPDFPNVLRGSLLDHIANGTLIGRHPSAHGEHGNVRRALLSPDGRNPTVTTCWTKRHGERFWRFTTLLPR